MTIDVIQGQYLAARAAPQVRAAFKSRVLSVGHPCCRDGGDPGVIGAFVINRQNGRPAVLSSWQVLSGAKGDPVFCDTAARRQPVAKLSRSHLGQGCDGALADLTEARLWNPTPLGQDMTIDHIGISRLGEILCHTDRSVAQNLTYVDGIGRYRVRYEVKPGEFEVKVICGMRIMACDVFSAGAAGQDQTPGNGALWYNAADRAAIGLQIAGDYTANSKAVIACSMDRVSRQLDIRMARLDDLFGLSELSEYTDGLNEYCGCNDPKLTSVQRGICTCALPIYERSPVVDCSQQIDPPAPHTMFPDPRDQTLWSSNGQRVTSA